MCSQIGAKNRDLLVVYHAAFGSTDYDEAP